MLAACLFSMTLLSTPVSPVFLDVPQRVYDTYPGAPHDEVTVAWQGTRAILERHYDEALHLMDTFQTSHPKSLVPSLGRMFLYHLRMLENFDFRYLAEFEAARHENEDRMQRFFNRKKAGSWELLIAGGSVGMAGSMEARRQMYWPAFRHGLNAVRILDDAKNHAPFPDSYFDVDYGRGTYHYFASWAQKKSLILAFMPDRRGQGIMELERCAENAPLTGPLCSYTLAYLFAQDGAPQKALRVIEPLHEKFPHNVLVRSLHGRLLAGLGKTNDGVAILDDILRENPDFTFTGYFLGHILHLHAREPLRVENLMKAFLNEKQVYRAPMYVAEAYLTLAEIAHRRSDDIEARLWFDRIVPGDLAAIERSRYLTARSELVHEKSKSSRR